MKHEGKVVIVTGAAQGIGFAIAKTFVQEGARVVVSDVDGAKGKEAAKTLGALADKPEDVLYVKCDVSRRLDAHNLVAATLEAFGDIDVLVSNAGIVHAAGFLDLSEDDFERVLNVNLKGPFLVGQAVAKYLVEKIKTGGRAGAIVNMSSINAVFAIANQVPYSVSKGGLSQLTKVMALALAPHGIRVNAVGPGSIMTEMLATVNDDPAARGRILSRTPLGRIGEANEIAAVVSFLASDEASYITGQTVYADGGRLPLNYTVPVPEE